jgi:ribosomal protein L11 methyltransferase
MNKMYKTVTFTATPADKDMITAILLHEGYEGAEERGNSTSISIPSNDFNEEMLSQVMQQFTTEYSITDVTQQNWNADWEQSFEPVKVGDFAVIRAHFHEPIAGVVHDVVVTPKMSFGTGHHATTYLMIEGMQKLDLAQKTVIDFGTGTGVLAILAHKMGAIKVLATDNDEWSINNAAENFAANGCEHIQLVQTEGMPTSVKADVILANINLNVIIANLTHIRTACHQDTQVLFSGLLQGDEPLISEKIVAAGFEVKNVQHKNNWICISATVTA